MSGAPPLKPTPCACTRSLVGGGEVGPLDHKRKVFAFVLYFFTYLFLAER